MWNKVQRVDQSQGAYTNSNPERIIQVSDFYISTATPVSSSSLFLFVSSTVPSLVFSISLVFSTLSMQHLSFIIRCTMMKGRGTTRRTFDSSQEFNRMV